MLKAREGLAFGRYAAAGGFAAEAGRAAYMAAYHAAQAYTVSRTGKAPKTHSGARSEFTRLARNEPTLTRALTGFLANAYELKAFADYDQASDVSPASAQNALDEAERFIAIVAALV